MASISRITPVVLYSLELTEQELIYIKSALNFRLQGGTLNEDCAPVTKALVKLISGELKHG